LEVPPVEKLACRPSLSPPNGSEGQFATSESWCWLPFRRSKVPPVEIHPEGSDWLSVQEGAAGSANPGLVVIRF
jgi:hypothetical protein